MEANKIKINPASIIFSIVVLILLIYVIIDFTITQPKIKKSINQITTEFNNMKIYMDTKIPVLDSALVIHTKQINEQYGQIKELQEITKVLTKSKNNIQ